MSAITRGLSTTSSGTFGTATGGTQILALNSARNFLQVHCESGTIAYTFDGAAPVVGGSGYTITQFSDPHKYDVWVPTGPVTVIGQSAGAAFTITQA